MPWVIKIVAANKDVGVTCGELIDTVSDFLHTGVSGDEYGNYDEETKRTVGNAYHMHRSRGDDVPGGRMGQGLLRADFLEKESMFMGVVEDGDVVKKRLQLREAKRRYPCVWVVKLGRRLIFEDVEGEERARDFERERDRERGRTNVNVNGNETSGGTRENGNVSDASAGASRSGRRGRRRNTAATVITVDDETSTAQNDT